MTTEITTLFTSEPLVAVTVTVPDSATGPVLPVPVVPPLELPPPQLTAPSTKTQKAAAAQAYVKRFLRIVYIANANAKSRYIAPVGGIFRKNRKNGEPAVLAAVTVTVVLPDVVTVVEGTEQVTLAKPLDTAQENETVPLKFLYGLTLMVAVPVAPG